MKFYIKPQPWRWLRWSGWSCILLKFYIKPQQPLALVEIRGCCILLKFYIKPQQRVRHTLGHSVVSYWNSTSNHNNCMYNEIRTALYLIEILHQTTTCRRFRNQIVCCILLKFYIKPQQRARHTLGHSCCILLKFYIKPQHKTSRFRRLRVVSYWNSTSNHNSAFAIRLDTLLYLIEILHQTTTIPPYPVERRMLYLIEILHQTTTESWPALLVEKLYLIEILHQTTTLAAAKNADARCILLKFYIKPQQRNKCSSKRNVVSYWNSTSNHNYDDRWLVVT